ncbi:hypothetical protein [Ruminiclostridium josui]|uniref:hypothetical protein n=1 Tax=Ruminiclostridium josui TaxID=1499 RepID=UPI0006D0739B|nr:hypothetical protein [Ruminiclostridium josui]
MHENAHGKDNVSVGAGVGLSEHARWQPKWTIEKYNAEMKLYDTEQIEGNLLLNEGISSLLTLLIGGSETPFNNANAYIGVGDGTTEAAPNQTGLMGENKSFAPMDATFPQVSGNTVTFRATFGPTSGNHPGENLLFQMAIPTLPKTLTVRLKQPKGLRWSLILG